MILTAAVGGLVAVQAPINAGLSRATGSLAAALISFAVGTVILAAIVVVSGQADGVASAAGRFVGTTWSADCSVLPTSTAALVTVKSIGAGGVARGRRSPGNSTTAVLLDRLGVLGLEKTPISAGRIAGCRPACWPAPT